MSTKVNFKSAIVGENGDLRTTYNVRHSDQKLIVDYDITVISQTRFGWTTASIKIESPRCSNQEEALDKLADHLDRMAKAIKARSDEEPLQQIPVYGIS